jgi:hypothetical protein
VSKFLLSVQKNITSFVFKKKTPVFCRKLLIVAKIIDHNIGPGNQKQLATKNLTQSSAATLDANLKRSSVLSTV